MANQYTPPDHAEVLALFEKYGSSLAIASAVGGAQSTWRQRRQNALQWARQNEIELRGGAVVPSMEVTHVTDQRDAEGKLTAFSVKQRPAVEHDPLDPDNPLPGFVYKRISTNRRGDGTLSQEWRIQSPEAAAKWQAVAEVLDKRLERLPPRAPEPAGNYPAASELLNQLTIADGHVGAMAWGVETGGANWDLKLAHSTILGGAMWLIDNLPAADTFLLKVLGDYTDTDGYVPATPASKHILDVDGRFPRIIDVAEDIIEQIVLYALKKHPKVLLVILPGNHDPLSSMWMRKLYTRIFANEPRVEVDQSIRNVWCLKFGKTLIGATHGDKISLPDMPSVFATDFAPLWGETVYRYCHSGHLHHKHLVLHVGKQLKGMMVIQHPTISARNAWAAERPFPEARELVGHSYHKNTGMRSALHFVPEMLEL